LAAELRLLQVGNLTIATDGRQFQANASKHAAISYQRAGRMAASMARHCSLLGMMILAFGCFDRRMAGPGFQG